MTSEFKWAFGSDTSSTCTIRVSTETNRFTNAVTYSITLSPFTVDTNGAAVSGCTTTAAVGRLPPTTNYRAIGSVVIYSNTGGTQGAFACIGVITQIPTGQLQIAFSESLAQGEYAISGCNMAAPL